MDRKKFSKKVIVIISILAVVAILATAISSVIGSGSGKSESKQTKDKYAKVEVKDDLVVGGLDVKDNTKEDDAVKRGDDYANKLASQYPDKQIEVKVSDKNGFVTNITKNYDPNKNSGVGSATPSSDGTGSSATGTSSLPKTSLDIRKGVLNFDRLVIVTLLDTPNPENYKVSILGYDLKYFPDRKIFQQVIQETDEEKIRNNVKVQLAQ